MFVTLYHWLLSCLHSFRFPSTSSLRLKKEKKGVGELPQRVHDVCVRNWEVSFDDLFARANNFQVLTRF